MSIGTSSRGRTSRSTPRVCNPKPSIRFKLRLLTPEEAEEWRKQAELEHQESLRRWPMSQRRNRCEVCGAFMPAVTYDHTRCKVCGESFLSQQ